MDSLDWHERFKVQAGWTKQLRQYLYQQVGLNKQSRILEVGCGTGVITSELNLVSRLHVTGVDIQMDRLLIAHEKDSVSQYNCADAYQLPFSTECFDIVIAHYLFLWLREPLLALAQMVRVLKPGGYIIALAEPDYLARIDNPQELWRLGEMQTQAIIQQGANPMAGRQLAAQFQQAGLVEIEYGVSGFQSKPNDIPDWFDSEWKILENDLDPLASANQLNELRSLDAAAYKNGSRIMWVPTFYAYGKKHY